MDFRRSERLNSLKNMQPTCGHRGDLPLKPNIEMSFSQLIQFLQMNYFSELVDISRNISSCYLKKYISLGLK